MLQVKRVGSRMFDLDIEDGTFLVRLARKAIESYLRDGEKIGVPEDTKQKLMEKCGVFVTLNSLKNGGELRGCIGYPLPTDPLASAVINSAIESATSDPRFPPVELDEFEGKVVIEVSVLTPPELIEVSNPMDYPKKVEMGRDGLIVERGLNKGLLLPQVAVEWKWDAEEFLSQCCIKAWLPPDSWLVEGVRISKFQAIVFGEETPRGEVKRIPLHGEKS